MLEIFTFFIVIGMIAGIIKGLKKSKRKSNKRKNNSFNIFDDLLNTINQAKIEKQKEILKENYLKNKEEYNKNCDKNNDNIKYNMKNQETKNDENLLNQYEKTYKTERINKKELGNKYELQIGEYFKSQDFKVFYNGINKGKLDGGIDLIAWSSQKVLLIQCKNHKEQIKQDLIRKFIGDCAIYENKYKDKIKNREIKRIFVSNSTADYGAMQFINQNKDIVEFMRIQANCR